MSEAEWKPDDSKRRIICAASVVPSVHGVPVTFVGPRHWDQHMHGQFAIASRLAGPDQLDMSREVQGFLDQFGTFHDRKAALVIALRHNQIKSEGKSGNPDSDELFSEDLY